MTVVVDKDGAALMQTTSAAWISAQRLSNRYLLRTTLPTSSSEPEVSCRSERIARAMAH